MSKFEKRMYTVAVLILICCFTFAGVGVEYIIKARSTIVNEECNCSPKFYDYIIDLKPDETHIYREDGKEYVIKPGGLDKFIQADTIHHKNTL
jgi:hypothetical protein